MHGSPLSNWLPSRPKGLRAFESRATAKPLSRGRTAGDEDSVGTSIDEAVFLEQVLDAQYREALGDLFDFCRGLQLRLDWGKVGSSIRVPTSDLSEPLTVAWIFPPNQSGWMGLRNLTLGFDVKSVASRPSATHAANQYKASVSAMPGATHVTVKNLFGRQLQPPQVVNQLQTIKDVVAAFVKDVNEGATSDTTSNTTFAGQTMTGS